MRAVLGAGTMPTDAEIDRYIEESTRLFVKGHAVGSGG